MALTLLLLDACMSVKQFGPGINNQTQPLDVGFLDSQQDGQVDNSPLLSLSGGPTTFMFLDSLL